MTFYKKAILFYNLDAGQSKKGRQLEIIKAHFEEHNIAYQIIKFPKPGEGIKQTIDQATINQADLVVAAGGDGTVSLISNKIIGSGLPLGILPLGTGNLLAQELKISLNLEKALGIITSDHPKTILMDTMKLEERFCLMNVSVGVSPNVMKKTHAKEKQRFGIFAYLVHLAEQFLGLKLHRFFVEYDGQNITFQASEVLVTNGQAAGVQAIKLADDIAINDGRLDLFIIKAANISDFFGLLISIFSKIERHDDMMKYIRFSEYCRIESPLPIPAQADGDPMGETPVEIRIVPKSLTVIVGENQEK